MLKSEFEEKWQGRIKTYEDWKKYKYEIWDDVDHIEHEKKDDNKREREEK